MKSAIMALLKYDIKIKSWSYNGYSSVNLTLMMLHDKFHCQKIMETVITETNAY